MKNCIGAIFIMMAGYAVSSELSEGDKRKVIDAVHIAVGTIQLIEGYDVSEEVTDEEAQLAEFAEHSFLESDDTEWWRCDDSVRFLLDDGCGDDGCPVKLAANPAMDLGMVNFAGRNSYARYSIQGLKRRWHWCMHDDDIFECTFVLDAGGDGTYYDFTAPSTTTRPDGHVIAQPAGSFKCERFFPREDTP